MLKNIFKIISVFILVLFFGWYFWFSPKGFQDGVGLISNFIGVATVVLAGIFWSWENIFDYLARKFPQNKFLLETLVDNEYKKLQEILESFEEETQKQLKRPIFVIEDEFDKKMKNSSKYSIIYKSWKILGKKLELNEDIVSRENFYNKVFVKNTYRNQWRNGNLKKEFKKELRKLIKHVKDKKIEDTVKNYKKDVLTDFTDGYLGQGMFEAVLAEIQNDKLRKNVLDVVAIISFRYLINDWEKVVEEEFKDVGGSVLKERKEFWKNTNLDLKLPLEVPEISLEALLVFLSEMEELQKNQKENIIEALDFLAEIGWIQFQGNQKGFINQQSFGLNTQVLDLLEKGLVERAKGFGKVNRYDSSVGCKLHEKSIEYYQKDDYNLAFFSKKVWCV